MIGDNATDDPGEIFYDLTLSMNKSQVKWLYVTMDHAYNTWSGGAPIEQEVLFGLKTEAWKLLLEAQFYE